MNDALSKMLQTEPELSADSDKIRLDEALRELKLSDERYRIATESNSEIIIEYNISDDSIYHVTQRVVELYGVQQKIFNAPAFLIENGSVYPESANEFMELFEKIRAGAPKAECTVKTRPVDGGMLWSLITLTTIYDNDHNPTRAIGILKDITQQKKTELLYENEVMYRDAMMRDAVLYYEADLTNRKITFGLEKQLASLGLPNTDDYMEALGVLCSHLIFPDDRKMFLDTFSPENLILNAAQGNEKLCVDYRRISDDLKPYWVQSTIYLMRNAQTGDVKGLCYVHNIHESKLRELDLQAKAERDLLTGLYNKVTTELMVKDAISSDLICGHISAFLIVDLDNFKNINDQLGHAFGDAVLSETAHKLQTLCRESDIVGRIGGDEFVLYLQNIPNAEAAVIKAKKICSMFHDAYLGSIKGYKISGTVGISILPSHGTTFDELYRKSDTALYSAKKRGKDSFCLYSDEIASTAVTSFSRAAIDRSSGKTFSENITEYIFRILYESRDLNKVVNAILELVTNHFNCNRGYIFELCENGDCCKSTFEWCTPGVPALPEALKSIDGEALEVCKKRFDRGGLYIMRSPDELPLYERQFPEFGKIQSRFQYALASNGSFHGFVGFDQYSVDFLLAEEELSVLQVVAQMLDVFLSEKHTNDQLVESGTILQAIADGLGTCTYIMNPETHLLRFVNKNTQLVIPQAEVGKLCYEAIRGFTAPCEDCPISMMRREGLQVYQAEMYNEAHMLWTKVDASLVKLMDGGSYGLLNCYDITKYKNSSDEYVVDLDAFTQDAYLYDALDKSTDDYLYMCDMPKNLFYFPEDMVLEFDLPGNIIADAIPLWSSKIHENERELFLQAMSDMVSGKTNVHCQEYRAKNKDGIWIWLSCRGYLEHDEAGRPTLFAGVITNLGKKSKIDPLSGLLNKYEFETRVCSGLAEQNGGALLLLGLDNFKNINNLYGWEFGDKVILSAAQTIQSLLPDQVQIYRLDGDKFGVFFSTAKVEDVVSLYNTVYSAFQCQQVAGDHRYYCTISGGYSVFSGEPVSFHTLFKQAEYALEYSKSSGKNRLNRYISELMSGKDRTLTLIERLRECVDRGCESFELYFQPQVMVPSHEVQSAEALLRWSCDEYGIVSPAEFIPLLEQTGLIHTVGRWVLQQAAEILRAWHKRKPGFIVNVNLSFAQMQDKEFIPFLANLVQDYQIPPSSLHLEITESCIVSGSHFLSGAFKELRSLGFQIEMDDFGTGYSSLEILKNAPADVVKIDRAFVKDITKSDFDATFIRFVVSLCHSVNIKVCLEGVETWEEYHLVEPMAVDLIQGYLFGRPESAKMFEELYL